jgi:hypothetical protein
MSTGKLVHYINIAKLLLENGPMTFNQLNAFLKNSNISLLKRDLDFLLLNKIITGPSEDDVSHCYAVAPSGISVLRFFNVIPLEGTIKTNS